MSSNSGCFQLRPENRLYIWPTHRIMNIRPENQAYLWPLPAQSRHSERSANGPVDLCSKRSPLGVARAVCFEQLAGVFASCGALQSFTFALNDSADALVERLLK